MGKHPINTWISKEELEEVRRRATAQGISQYAYLQKLIEKDLHEPKTIEPSAVGGDRNVESGSQSPQRRPSITVSAAYGGITVYNDIDT